MRPADRSNNWWQDAIRLAEKEEGRDLALSKGNAYHGLRYYRRTELRNVPQKYGRWLVGHSVATRTTGIFVSKGVYLGLKPRDLAEAAQLADTDDADDDW